MYTSIVVATDGSPGAGSALSEAARLARAFDAPLHLVRVAPDAATAALDSDPKLGDGQPEPPAVEALAVAAAPPAATDHLREALLLPDGRASAPTPRLLARQLDDVAGDLTAAGIRAEVHALVGDPVVGILAVAKAERADLVVVGSRQAGDGDLGRVPSEVAQRAGCTVLIVKPG